MDNGTILTAVIGASAATIGVVVTKDAKVSEFRQQWVEGLRNDVAELCAKSVALFNGNLRFMARADNPELEQVDTNKLVEEANNLTYRIRLRLNPSEKETDELISAMGTIVSIATLVREPLWELDKAVLVLLDKTQVILKKEWKRHIGES